MSYWIQEAYCRLGEAVSARAEALSDSIAERRYRTANPKWDASAPAMPALPMQIRNTRLINGHKYLH